MSRIELSYRNILRIAAPVVASQLSYTAMGVIDTMMVGQLGIVELGGVGLGNMITWWFLSFFYGVLSIVNTYVAQSVGAGDRRGVGRTLWQGIHLAIVSGVLIMLSTLVMPGLFRRLGADPLLTGLATDYARVRVLGGVGLSLLLVADNFYRGLGRTSVPMWANWCQLVLNCGLNYLLIFGRWGLPELGVTGAALGTVIAQSTVGVALLASIFVHRGYGRRFLLRRTWRPHLPTLRTLAVVGLPVGCQFFMEMGGIALFTAMIARLGEAEMAATNAVIQAWSVTFMVAVALAVTATTLVGQCLGAGRFADARVAVGRVMVLGGVVTVLGGVLYVGFPETLMHLFVRGTEVDELIGYARPLFAIVVVCLFFDLRFNLLSGALRGAGDTTYSMVVNIGSAWLVFVPLTLFVTPRWGLVGAWWCLAVHVFLMALLIEVRYRGDRWIQLFQRREQRRREGREPVSPCPEPATMEEMS